MPAALGERDPAAEGGALNREVPCLILFLPADPACHHAPSGHEWNNVPLALWLGERQKVGGQTAFRSGSCICCRAALET